jgi:hypothetical protein
VETNFCTGKRTNFGGGVNFVKVLTYKGEKLWHKVLGHRGRVWGPGANPIKLFFSTKEEFFRFSLVSLHVCYTQKKHNLLQNDLA